jgi:oligopeptidase B
MLSYSPYDNIKPQRYPHFLAIAGYNDPRVFYHEPAKFIAKLRANKIGESVVMLKTYLEEGHGGASGRYDLLKEDAFIYGVILHFTGEKI